MNTPIEFCEMQKGDVIRFSSNIQYNRQPRCFIVLQKRKKAIVVYDIEARKIKTAYPYARWFKVEKDR